MMRKILKITVIVLVLVFVIAQFVQPNFTNPPLVESETLAASTEVPPDVQSVLARSCNDCHTNQTSYPWYSYVTPFNWYLADHIEKGRHEVNFSVWNTYSAQKKIRKLGEVCEQVEHGEMPLPSYLWIHRSAALTPSEVDLLCNWARTESAKIAGG